MPKASKKAKDPNMPKRAQSAYFIWMQENRERIKKPGMRLVFIQWIETTFKTSAHFQCRRCGQSCRCRMGQIIRNREVRLGEEGGKKGNLEIIIYFTFSPPMIRRDMSSKWRSTGHVKANKRARLILDG